METVVIRNCIGNGVLLIVIYSPIHLISVSVTFIMGFGAQFAEFADMIVIIIASLICDV